MKSQVSIVYRHLEILRMVIPRGRISVGRGEYLVDEKTKQELLQIGKKLRTQFLSGLSIEYCLGYRKQTRTRSKSTPTILKHRES